MQGKEFVKLPEIYTPSKHFSMCSLLGFLVKRLTTTVTTKAIGNAITIGSTVGHGMEVDNMAWPVIALAIPSASADFLYSKTSQNKLIKVPTTKPDIAPALVQPFQKRANTYMERNAAAVMENHMDVPTAIMLVGSMNPMITAMIIAMAIPNLATITEAPPVLLVTVS